MIVLNGNELSRIGDALMFTPALRALRRAHPDEEIVYQVSTLTDGARILETHPAIDRIEVTRPAPEAIWIDAWGARLYGEANGLTYAEAFAAVLGLEVGSNRLDYHQRPTERRHGAEMAHQLGQGRPIVVIARFSRNHPGLGYPLPTGQQLHADVWTEVAEELDKLGFVPVAIGSADDARSAWPYASACGYSLGDAAGLIAAARLVLTVETGIYPLAAALGRDVVATITWGPGWFLRYDPVRPGQRIVQVEKPAAEIDAEDILRAARPLLECGAPSRG